MTLAFALLALCVLLVATRSVPRARHYDVNAAALIRRMRERQIGEWP